MPTPHKNTTTPRHNLRTLRTPIGDLTPHPRNARNGDVDAVAESLEVNGQFRPIVVARGGVILAGNHTYAAAMQLGWPDIMTVTLDLDPESPEAIRIMLADNRTADLGGYDDALLLELIQDLDTVEGSGYDDTAIRDLEALVHMQQTGDLDLDRYTDAVNVPQYEPTGPPPAVSKLRDESKAEELRARIDATEGIPDDVRAYLHAAAARHIVFDYRAAAEFYPHAPAEVQRLMEESALVIIDVQDAIRHGYAALEDTLAELEASDVQAMGWESDAV